MWSEAVNGIPDITIKSTDNFGTECTKKFLENILDNHTARYERIFWEGEYKSAESAYNSIRKTVRMQGYPIKIHVRGEVIYLERRDI